MRVFGLPVSCPHCDGALELINSSTNLTLSVGIFKCEDCHREYETTIRLRPLVTSERSLRRRVQRAA